MLSIKGTRKNKTNKYTDMSRIKNMYNIKIHDYTHDACTCKKVKIKYMVMNYNNMKNYEQWKQVERRPVEAAVNNCEQGKLKRLFLDKWKGEFPRAQHKADTRWFMIDITEKVWLKSCGCVNGARMHVLPQ